eukprot:6229495-Pyramimonas_sp.AAC.2
MPLSVLSTGTAMFAVRDISSVVGLRQQSYNMFTKCNETTGPRAFGLPARQAPLRTNIELPTSAKWPRSPMRNCSGIKGGRSTVPQATRHRVLVTNNGMEDSTMRSSRWEETRQEPFTSDLGFKADPTMQDQPDITILSQEERKKLLPGSATGAQYAYYWGVRSLFAPVNT